MENEIWVPVKGYEEIYQISNYGILKRIKESKNRRIGIMKSFERGGYLAYWLSNNSKRDKISIHRLVAMHFIPNTYNKPFVNHKDCNKYNNRADNLEWCTREENISHAKEMNRYKKGQELSTNKLKPSDISEIREKYIPYKYSTVRLGKEYGVNSTTIWDIVKGKKWKHI